MSVQLSTIYTKKLEECFEIDTKQGEFIYEHVGLLNGNTKQHSVAYVKILPNCSSQAHYHPHSEESYIITSGQAVLTIDGKTRNVSKGDVVKIPIGKVHQIFNKHKEVLELWCICAPAWTQECYVLPEQTPAPQSPPEPIYCKNKEMCKASAIGDKVTVCELLGIENGDAKQHSIALLEIEENGSSSAHYHPETEESYIITEGEGRLVIDGIERMVTAGDVATIPVGKVHQIFNNTNTPLKLYAVCAPAWTPKCGIYTKA